jgi:hypothetical protein
MRIEVELQNILQGLRLAKRKERCIRRPRTRRFGEGEESRRTYDSRRYGSEKEESSYGVFT